MLKPAIEAALNDQLNQEQSAAHKYLAMAAWFDQQNLSGFATFMRKQAEEERDHAMKIFDYLADRGGTIKLGAIDQPDSDFGSALGVFEAAQKNEQANTKSIHDLYALALKENDFATQSMLHWFIDEQVEEEQWCEEALAHIGMVGDNHGAMLILDQQYGGRASAGA